MIKIPFPSEHSCRLNNPDKYDRFARKNGEQNHDGKPIDVIYGIAEGKSEIQALRFPKDRWDADAARNVCNARGGSFEAATSDARKTKEKNGKIFYLNQLQGTLELLENDRKQLMKPVSILLKETEHDGLLRLPRSTLLVGDGIYNGIFHPSEEIEKSYMGLDHQPFTMNHGDGIEDEIGWMEQPLYDKNTMKLTAVPILNLGTKQGVTALGYIQNRIYASKAPETSVGFWATQTQEDIEKLQLINQIVAREWEFDHNSLVNRGACGPIAGAGIGLHKNKEDAHLATAIKMKIKIDTSEVDEAINKLEKINKLEEKDMENSEQKTLTKEEMKAIVKQHLTEIENEKDAEIKKNKMALLGAALQSGNMEEAKKYLDVLPVVNQNPEHELLKRIEALERKPSTRTTDTRDDSTGQPKTLTKEQHRIAQLITGRGICKFAATGERLNLHVRIDDERIPNAVLTEVA